MSDPVNLNVEVEHPAFYVKAMFECASPGCHANATQDIWMHEPPFDYKALQVCEDHLDFGAQRAQEIADQRAAQRAALAERAQRDIEARAARLPDAEND